MSRRVISILIFFLIAPLILSAANPSELEQQIERGRRERGRTILETKKTYQSNGERAKRKKKKKITTKRTAIPSAFLILLKKNKNPFIPKILPFVPKKGPPVPF